MNLQPNVPPPNQWPPNLQHQRVQLRPLGFGELLDTTFNLYRRNFLLFLGVSVLPLVLWLIGVVAIGSVAAFGLGISIVKGLGGMELNAILILVAFGFVIFVAYYISKILSQAAAMKAVSDVYLGYPATISTSFSSVMPNIGRLLLITLILGAAGLLPLAVPAGLGVGAYFVGQSGNVAGAVLLGAGGVITFFGWLVYVVFLGLRYILAIPACVVENRSAIDSMQRSVFLMKENYLRTLGILFLIGVITAIIGYALLIPTALLSILLVKTSVPWLGTVMNQAVQFAVSALVTPLAIIAIALTYYDARVRKEAFDIELMMREAGGVSSSGQAYTASQG